MSGQFSVLWGGGPSGREKRCSAVRLPDVGIRASWLMALPGRVPARTRVEGRRRWGYASAGKADRPVAGNLLVFWSACCREQGVTLASLEFPLAPAGGSSVGISLAAVSRRKLFWMTPVPEEKTCDQWSRCSMAAKQGVHVDMEDFAGIGWNWHLGGDPDHPAGVTASGAAVPPGLRGGCGCSASASACSGDR